MSNTKETSPKKGEKVEQKVVVPVENKPTIAKVFQELGKKGTKDRNALAEGIISHFKAKGITENVKGKPITVERVKQQISAMIRDISAERGKDKGSWWSKLSVVENETEFKLVEKA